jgi:uncharacterized SAM-binding protein YcdF (DUF218 family)
LAYIEELEFMFFILSKVLLFLLLPLVWIIAILIYSLLTKNIKKRKQGLILSLALILFFSNDFIINETFQLWEEEPVPIADLPSYEFGIVLTGITNSGKDLDDRVFFQKGADRLLHTVQLYKLGKIKKILITGGAAKLIAEGKAEADELKKVFLYCGVNENDLFVEDKAKNTRENALFSKLILDSLGVKEKQLLITSAFHMRRAKGCFDKAGIKVDIYPVDYFTSDRKFTPDKLLIPSESALGKWALLIHEVTGYVTYKITGYI